MRAGHGGVVVDDGDGVCDVIDELLAPGATVAVTELDADEKLRDGDRRHGDFVVVVDDLVEGRSRTVGVDQECRVKQESRQGRVSISNSFRAAATSRAKPGSGRWRRSTALTSRPVPVLTGSSWATTLPRRKIVNRSPRCSTASRMSEKFLAASVALTSVTRSDYQISVQNVRVGRVEDDPLHYEAALPESPSSWRIALSSS